LSCELAQEKEAREDNELETGKLSQELEEAEQELKSLKTQFKPNFKGYKE
jgi:hypothetical protein